MAELEPETQLAFITWVYCLHSALPDLLMFSLFCSLFFFILYCAQVYICLYIYFIYTFIYMQILLARICV